MYYDVEDSLVIESGSRCIKAGFAGNDEPYAVFPSIVGRPGSQGLVVGFGQMYYAVGHGAERKKDLLNLRHPVEHGIVTDWSNIESIWHHTFYNELRTPPEEQPLLITEDPLNPKANREKTIQIMFEAFDIPGLYLSTNQLLSLYAMGCTSGLVVDLGHMSSRIVPVLKGQVLTSAVTRLDIAGSQLTNYLQELLSGSGNSFSAASEAKVINGIKEKLCCISVESGASGTGENKMYKLPDGQLIQLKSECYRCPEAFFQPSLIGLEESLPQDNYRQNNKFM